MQLLKETHITIPELAKLSRRHRSTIFRWIHSGCGGVRLESLAIGGRLVSSMEAYERFITALNAERIASGTGSQQ